MLLYLFESLKYFEKTPLCKKIVVAPIRQEISLTLVINVSIYLLIVIIIQNGSFKIY